MFNDPNIEQRLTHLEKQVSELQTKLEQKSNSPNWLEQMIGSISGEEFFLKALEYGKQYRQSAQLIDDDMQ